MLLNNNEMFTKAAIEQYFVKEKKSGKWNMIAGVLAVFSGVVLFFIGATSYYYGAALPPVVLGIAVVMLAEKEMYMPTICILQS